ncbi:MAG: zinc ABC transporter substrate-binding protein [Spirochaetales bacterium]|nr:zinc ABC transporter substrate-binding protein [Spirochaetales bacterium]
MRSVHSISRPDRLFGIVAVLVTLMIALPLFAGGGQEATDEADAPLRILATTGHVGDAVSRVAPNADTFVLVGPGLDPHTYEASTRDIEQMRSADIVFWNGLHLEAQMEDAIRSLGDAQLELGEEIPESMLLPWEDDLFDPHIWNSTEIWSLVVQAIADRLSEMDPAGATAYQQNAAAYIAEIEAADAYARERLATIPAENRVLVSGHDAFNYFAAAYGFESLAIEGISTEDEASLQDLRDLADYVVDNNVVAIFYENITNPQATIALQEAVEARGASVGISEEELFSDALGDAPPLDTYLGTFRHNVDAITNTLGAVGGM